jgi:hypothetical protein
MTPMHREKKSDETVTDKFVSFFCDGSNCIGKVQGEEIDGDVMWFRVLCEDGTSRRVRADACFLYKKADHDSVK